MRYYLIAGERSGDLHGGNLIKALKQRDPEAVFRGFGGDYMQENGMDVVVHYRDLAFMGFLEVLTSLNKISGYIRQCKNDILDFRPDVIVLIDYGGFNRRLARFGKENGIRVFYYIPPKVWAWRQRRALDLKANVDRMFVILPFERDFFRKFDWEVDYVGNPVLDAVKAHPVNTNFRSQHQLPTDKPIVALLPGSRKQELQRIVPLMEQVVKQMPHVHFVVATVSNLNRALYGALQGQAHVTFIEGETYDLLVHSQTAMVTSGTATLETGLFKVPQVVVYKMNTLTYWIARLIIRVPYISLINLIANREVVRELIQHQANGAAVAPELERMLSDKTYRQQMLSGYDAIYNALDTGSASENTARLMVEDLLK